MIWNQVAEFLKAQQPITDKVGDGVWLSYLPEGKRTGVIFEQVPGGSHEITTDGRVIIRSLFRFTSIAQTAPAADALHAVVVDVVTCMSEVELTSGGTSVSSDALEDEHGPDYDIEADLWSCQAEIVFVHTVQ